MCWLLSRLSKQMLHKLSLAETGSQEQNQVESGQLNFNISVVEYQYSSCVCTLVWLRCTRFYIANNHSISMKSLLQVAECKKYTKQDKTSRLWTKVCCTEAYYKYQMQDWIWPKLVGGGGLQDNATRFHKEFKVQLLTFVKLRVW